MARKSSVERLPPDILEALQSLLRDPRITQLEATEQINAILEAQGHDESVSKSAVNRYSMRMQKVGERLTQSREMAKMWIGKLGSQPQGETGKLLNEIIRTLAFETTMSIAENEEPASPKLLSQLALAVQRLEASATDNLKRDEEIRKQERARATEAAAETAASVGKANGLSQQAVTEIKNQILGIQTT
ncbi:MAG: DUF3486 family protein [Gammaproteobacteria bacterium]|nr:DUF3486 family protein [Gammaproteobacteria bacterium]